MTSTQASLAALWRQSDTLSRFVCAFCLLLVIFAYLPTLRADYVTQDQWRAFRYSVQAQTPYAAAKACASMIPPYYSRTGRPLVWISECLEHAAVARISDFAALRAIPLSIALLTVMYLGAVVAPFVGGLAMGVIAAAAFALAPGYSFIVLQGLTGGMVLISIVLGAASFRLLRRRIENPAASSALALPGLMAPLALFLAACLIYPAWAFVAVALTWLALSFDVGVSRAAMARRLGVTLLFYFAATLLYYGIEKLIEAILAGTTGRAPDMGPYAFSIQLSPTAVLDRALEAARRFCEMPPLNFAAPPGLLPAALAGFCAHIGWQEWKLRRTSPAQSCWLAAATLLTGCGVLLAAVSPWLFSRVDQLASRYLATWYLFFCASTVLLFRVAVGILPWRAGRFEASLAALVLLLPIALTQSRLSSLEVEVSGLEVQTIRSALNDWLDHKGYRDQRYLLFVRPLRPRPAFAEQRMPKAQGLGENAVLSSAMNPVSIPWMIDAVLRERNDHPIGRSVALIDCGFDQPCVRSALRDPKAVVIGIADTVKVTKTSEMPFVINLSLITTKSVTPVIEPLSAPQQ
jgi:hypothetical protein